MKFLKILAKPVTVPIAAVKNGVRLVRLGVNAKKLLEVGDEGADDWDRRRAAGDTSGALYRSSDYWARLLSKARDVWMDLPLPEEIRDMKFLTNALTNWKTTLGGLAIALAAVAKVANDPNTLTDATTLAMFGAAWAAFNAKDQNVTGGTKAATSEAESRVN